MSIRKIVSTIVLLVILAVPLIPIIWSQFIYSHVDEDEAITVIAHYEECGIASSVGNPVLSVYFYDHEPLDVIRDIDGVKEKLNTLEPGTELVIKQHTKNDFIMSIRCGDWEICSYDDMLKFFDLERNLFIALGVIVYGICIGVYIWIACLRRKKRKSYRQE